MNCKSRASGTHTSSCAGYCATDIGCTSSCGSGSSYSSDSDGGGWFSSSDSNSSCGGGGDWYYQRKLFGCKHADSENADCI